MSKTVEFDAQWFLGPQVIVNLFSAFLAGVATVQVYMYYQTFRNDPKSLKILVGVLWVLDIVHTALTSAGFYQVCVFYFGHPEKFDTAPMVLLAAIFLAGAVYFLVQSFFSYRVWLIVRSRILGVACWLMTFIRGGTVIALGSVAVRMKSLREYSNQYWWLLSLSIVAATLGDILMALSLSWALWQQKGGMHEGTSLVVDRLILWTMQTGVLTSVTSVVLLICFLTMPHNWIWISILFIIPRLYANSLLSSLNGRKSLRLLGRSHQTFETTDHPSRDPPPISIEMTTYHSDSGHKVGYLEPKGAGDINMHASHPAARRIDLESRLHYGGKV